MLDRAKAYSLAAVVLLLPLLAVWTWMSDLPRPQFSVEDRLLRFGADARARLLPRFLRAGVPYPPSRIVLVGLKDERRLQVYAAAHGGPLRFTYDQRILAAAGGPGPKLREGDRQVPEGVYAIRYLNPNSIAYVSLMVGYPNAFDRARAAADGRDKLGGDIVIHGPTAGTAGCLALDNAAVEDIFTLVADAGTSKTRIILAPHDLRDRKPPPKLAKSKWDKALYARLASKLAKLPRPAATGYMPSAVR